LAIPVGYKDNFRTLARAFDAGQVCLVECTDKATRNKVMVICAVQMVGKEYKLVPFAKMFEGNPYDEVEPPEDSNDPK
jgi:hypothetical protein